MAAVTSAKFEVRVFDTAPDAIKSAEAQGLESVDALDELAAWADGVVTVLPTPEALIEVIGTPGDGGSTLTGGGPNGLVIIDVGSGAPVRTRELAEELAREDCWLVDAPVSGSPGMAEQGKLIANLPPAEFLASRQPEILSYIAAFHRGEKVK